MGFLKQILIKANFQRSEAEKMINFSYPGLGPGSDQKEFDKPTKRCYAKSRFQASDEATLKIGEHLIYGPISDKIISLTI